MVFAENDEFMEIQPDDSKKLQKHMKRHWFYKAWRIRAAPDQETIVLQKNQWIFNSPMDFLDFQWKV